MAVPNAFEQEDHFVKKRLESKTAIKQTTSYSFFVKLVGNSVCEE
jgi:hypothetical protein